MEHVELLAMELMIVCSSLNSQQIWTAEGEPEDAPQGGLSSAITSAAVTAAT